MNVGSLIGSIPRCYMMILAVLSLIPLRALTQENSAVVPAPETPRIWGTRWQEKLARVKQGGIDFIMVGDSITEAWDYPQNRDTWNTHYAPRNGVGLGFSGARTENILWMLDNGLVDGISPRVAVVLIGTNNTDWKHFPKANTPEEIAAGIEKIVRTLHAKLPKTKILLLRIFPRADMERAGDTGQKASELARQRLREKWVQWLDLNKLFLKPDGTIDSALMPDLLHPNPAGDKLWAQAMEPAIIKLWGNRR